MGARIGSGFVALCVAAAQGCVGVRLLAEHNSLCSWRQQGCVPRGRGLQEGGGKGAAPEARGGACGVHHPQGSPARRRGRLPRGSGPAAWHAAPRRECL